MPSGGGGGTESLSLGTTAILHPLFFDKGQLQIYSPRFSWIPKNSPLKSALSGELYVLHIPHFTKLLF